MAARSVGEYFWDNRLKALNRTLYGSQGVQGLLDYSPAQILFFVGREFGIAQQINDAPWPELSGCNPRP